MHQCHWLGQFISATYKSVLSVLKHLKSKHRSVLTNTCVKRIALNGTKEYKPDVKKNYSGQELSETSL